MTRPEIGVHLRDAAPLITAVKAAMVRDHLLLDFEQALPDPDGVTVYISNHGPVFAPLLAPALTVDRLLQLGGYDELVAVTLFHRFVQVMPGVAPLLRRYFGHSTRQLQSLSGLMEMIRARRFNILGTTPEGSSSTFCYDEPIGAFTRPGLMLAALQSDAQMVLAAQKGAEVFGQPVRLPGDLRLPMPHAPRGLMLPFWYPGCRADVTVRYRRYEPTLSADELEALPRDERRRRLGLELTRVRRQLLELYRSIP